MIHAPVRRRSTDPRAVAEAQRLLENHHDHPSVAAVLNQPEMKTAHGKNFNAENVSISYVVLSLPAVPDVGNLPLT